MEKSAESAELKINCPSCNRENDSEMSFCLFCGKGLRQQAVATRGNNCPRCGRFDQLNVRYCIFCGADTTSGALSVGTGSRELNRLSWEMDQPAGAKTGVSTRAELTEAAQSGIVWGVAAAGLISGVFVAFALAPAFQRAAIQSLWPNASLVLYTKHSEAQVVIEPARDARTFTVGKVGANGALRITDLQPARYIVAVSAPNYQTAVVGMEEELAIDAQHPTVIGFPNRLELVPKHTEGDQ
jgi:hypothetical protein